MNSEDENMTDPQSLHTAYVVCYRTNRYRAYCSCGWAGSEYYPTVPLAYDDVGYHQQQNPTVDNLTDTRP